MRLFFDVSATHGGQAEVPLASFDLTALFHAREAVAPEHAGTDTPRRSMGDWRAFGLRHPFVGQTVERHTMFMGRVPPSRGHNNVFPHQLVFGGHLEDAAVETFGDQVLLPAAAAYRWMNGL